MTVQTLPLSSRVLHLPERPLRAVAADVVLDSNALLKGQREIVIQHGDRFYRLRHTSNDKLILTK